MTKTDRCSDPGLPIVSIDSRQDADLDGFEMWHELCRPVLQTRRVEAEGTFQSSARFCETAGVVFGETCYGATRFERSPAQVRNGESDHIALHFLQHGREIGEADGYPLEVSNRQIVLQDWARPFVKESTAVHQLSAIIPRDLIPLSSRLFTRCPVHSWDIRSPGGVLLSNSLRAIFAELETFSMADGPKIANAFVGLINALLAADFENHAIPTGKTVQAVEQYVRQNLQNPHLGLKDIQEAFTLSRSSAYRMFEPRGGIRTFIQTERLAACHRELVRAKPATVSVRRIAERWAFHDISYFHRVFRKRFGMTPKEVIYQRNRDADSQFEISMRQRPEITTFHQWIGS
ncbi:MAG: AraC family transcriptional regulator [Verrucomicrobiota bacterium]